MYKTILFDFDGTLINTHDLIVKGLNEVSLLSRGIAFTHEEHDIIVGKPLETQLDYLTYGNGQRYIAPFQKWYRQNHDLYVRPYEEMEELLESLKYEGYKMGIVTNNSRQCLEMGLRYLGLNEFFETIVTRDDVKETKPHPQGIIKALKNLNSSPQETLFIGDSSADMMAAHYAGVAPVMVGWTTLSLEKRQQYHPMEVVETPWEIAYLLTLLKAESA